MFDFIFKRSGAKTAKTATTAAGATKQGAPAPVSAASVKQAALAQAAMFSGDEAAAAAFILQCPFADARLIAAAQLQTAPVLEATVQAMRNTDRRVVKLLQSRLDEIRQRTRSQEQARQCIATARQLSEAPRLMANQVVDLDRAWQGIVLVGAPQAAEFTDVRARLTARLEEQARLQHALRLLLVRLQQASADEADNADNADNADHRQPDNLHALLQECADSLAMVRASLEAAALPAPLLRDIEAARPAVQQRLEASLRVASPVVAEVIEIDAIPASAPIAEKSIDTPVSAQARQAYVDALDGLENSLQQGGLHAASEFDRRLRRLELDSARITQTLASTQRAQLSAVRAELARLQAWARWGGNISREELLKAALTLPGLSLTPAELAKKVGSLRERWKSLDSSAGAATNDAWRLFDAACSAAYAPAAAHFKKLAQERDQNLHIAEALIAAVREQAAGLPAAEAIDGKQLAQLCAQQAQAWQRLGTIERKEKKRLDRDFAQAMQGLLQPLQQRRAAAIRLREQMIAQLLQLQPADASALESLRLAQERWQAEAKALPLERGDEQALWQRFRAACDAVFAARKQGAAAADGERRAHHKAREDLCATLEAALGDAEPVIAIALREAQAAWPRLGAVPRALEKAIETRYQAAVAALQARLALARRAASAAQSDALCDKLRLCQQAEAAVLGRGTQEADLVALWENLPVLPAPFERALAARFAAATAAATAIDCGPDAGYAVLLEQNRAVLSTQLLRCEILASVDSPEEFSRSRLQLQVEVLQSSLQAGQKPLTAQAQLLALCALPAATDARDAARIERLLVQLQE